MNKKRLAVAGLSVGLVAVAGIGANDDSFLHDSHNGFRNVHGSLCSGNTYRYV